MFTEDIATDRLVLRPARMEAAAALDELLCECRAYFAFDPPHAIDRDCAEHLIVHGSLPPGGVRENYRLYCAYRGAEMIGFFDLYLGFPDANTAYISTLFVSGAQRGQGFGQEIFSAVRERLKAHGFSRVRLGVSLRNWTGLAFWFGRGFRTITAVQCRTNADDSSAFGAIELQCVLGGSCGGGVGSAD